MVAEAVVGIEAGPPLSVALNGWFWNQAGTGSGQYLVDLLRSLLPLSQSDLYTLFVPAAHSSSFVSPDDAHGRLRVVPLTTPFDGKQADLAKLWFEQVAFPSACRHSGVDLAHVPYWGPPARSAVPLMTTVHDLIPLILPAYRGSPAVRLYTRLVSHAARRAAWVLTDSHASAGDIHCRLGIPRQRIRVIHLAAEERYRPEIDAAMYAVVRARYRLPPAFILYLGGFDQRKNVPRLIEAYALLAARHPATPALVLAGRLPAPGSALFCDPQAEAQAHGVADRVHFAGWIAEEDKPALYGLATCFAFPSLYEGFGLPVLEAMASGVPVVTSNRSSLPEIAGDGGVLVDPDSATDIARGLELLALDARVRSEYAGRALERARDFSWDATARATRLAYVESRAAGLPSYRGARGHQRGAI